MIDELKDLIHMQQEAIRDLGIEINNIKSTQGRDISDQWKIISELTKEVKKLQNNQK